MLSINNVQYHEYVYAIIYIQLKFNYKVRAGLFSSPPIPPPALHFLN